MTEPTRGRRRGYPRVDPDHQRPYALLVRLPHATAAALRRVAGPRGASAWVRRLIEEALRREREAGSDS